MFSTQLCTSFSQASLYVFNPASHKLLSSLAICFRLSFIRASLQFWPSVFNRPSHTSFSQDTFFPNAIENIVLPPLHRRPRPHLLLLLTTTSDSSSETTMIEALDKTRCYALQKQNQKKEDLANTTRFQTESSLSPLSIKFLKTSNFPSLDNAPQKLTSPTSKNSLSQNSSFLSLDNGPQKLTFPTSQKSLSQNSNFLSPNNGPQKLTFPTSKNSLSKIQLSFSRQWTPATHIPHLKKLSLPQNSKLSFSRQCTQKRLTFPTPKNTLSLSFFLSLSLSLSLSLKSPNFLSLDNAPQKLTLPTSKNTLSLSLCLNQRASGSAHPFLPRTHSLGRKRAGSHVGTRRARRRFKVEREKSHTTLSVPFTGTSVVVLQWAKEGRSQVSK